MHIYYAGKQLYQYSGYSETESTPLANDVPALDVLKRVVNAQSPRYNQVSLKFLWVSEWAVS